MTKETICYAIEVERFSDGRIVCWNVRAYERTFHYLITSHMSYEAAMSWAQRRFPRAYHDRTKDVH